MLKVLKFGGSSMADAHQFAKVKAIVDSDPSRRVVVVSAAGKRSRDDHKLTDLLYLCYAHLQYGVSCDAVFDMIRSRYLSIRDELHLSTPLEAEFAALREKMDRGISQDELVSRGEYFAARLMAEAAEAAQASYYNAGYTPSYASAASYANGSGLTRSAGVNNYNGRRETYYSSNVLYHHRTGEWTQDSEGFWRDSDGYYVVAAGDMAQGSTFTGSKGDCKVYDSGCAAGTTDYYTGW